MCHCSDIPITSIYTRLTSAFGRGNHALRGPRFLEHVHAVTKQTGVLPLKSFTVYIPTLLLKTFPHLNSVLSSILRCGRERDWYGIVNVLALASLWGARVGCISGDSTSNILKLQSIHTCQLHCIKQQAACDKPMVQGSTAHGLPYLNSMISKFKQVLKTQTNISISIKIICEITGVKPCIKD